ncbi:MAG: hypothetical protein WBM63_00980, partial [Sedimenticolaceae bacterium]
MTRPDQPLTGRFQHAIFLEHCDQILQVGGKSGGHGPSSHELLYSDDSMIRTESAQRLLGEGRTQHIQK